jgi:flagellar hook-length control protein FliK
MTIEKSPVAASNHKATARADSQSNKSKSMEADPQSGGFMAILGAVDDPSAAPVALAQDPISLDAIAKQSAAQDSGAPQNTALDAATLLQQNPQIAAAQAQMAVATATSAATTKAAATATATANVSAATATAAAKVLASASASIASAASTAAGMASDASALTENMAPATLPPSQQPLTTEIPLPLETTAQRSAVAAAPTSANNAAAPIALQGDALTTGQSSTQGLQHAVNRAHSGKDLQPAAADAASASHNPATAVTEKAETAKWISALEQARSPQTTKFAEPVFAPLLVKIEKSTSDRVALAFKGSEPGYSGTALGVSAPEFSQSGVSATAPMPEMQVAEQVTYWVSQNVQNAELTLDGLGQVPVEVSISVQGKEAQITFRTDEAATRSVLEGASAHLKDMLQREGMVLTGVSVGTSGSGGDANAGERRSRQSARQGWVASQPVTAAPIQEAGRLVGTVAGRSVDLFV